MSAPGKGNHNSGFRFGSFEIDVAAGELRKHGLRIRLADQPFAVLSVLVERAGQIVTREELQQRLWPGDNLVDSEHGLNKAINKIRDALGDSPAYPRFIETLPKRGYKFIGHLEPIEARSTSSRSRPPETPVRPVRSHRMAWTVAALVLMAVSLAALGFRTHPPQSAVIQASILLAPEGPLGPLTPVLSPDGSHLAFIARKDDADGKNLLWIRPLDSGSARSFEGTERAGHPFWSPDGQYVGFFSGTVLKRIERGGGPASIIGNFRSHGRGGTWNRHGIILFGTFSPGPIYSVPATGGTPVPVTRVRSAAGQISHRWPYFLPDGNHFLYSARTVLEGPKHETNAIYIGSLDGTADQFLVYADSNAICARGYLLFVRQRNLMAQPFDPARLRLKGSAQAMGGPISMAEDHGLFSASETGLLVYQPGVEPRTELIWFDRSGRQIGAVGKAGWHFRPRISGDGKWVAVDCLSPGRINRDIWIYDSARGLGTQVTFDPFVHTHPVWSPDANQLVFASSSGEASSQRRLFKMNFGGGQAEEVLGEGEGDKTVSDWARDGRFLAYNYQDPKTTKLAIWILRLDGKHKPFPFQPVEYDQRDGQFSPDGRWLAYTSAASGREEVYVARFPEATDRRRVSTNGGSQPRWRSNGSELYYLAQDDNLMGAQIRSGHGSCEIGSVRQLFQSRPSRVGIGHIYDVSPDGKRFLVNTLIQRTSQPVALVVNWSAALEPAAHR